MKTLTKSKSKGYGDCLIIACEKVIEDKKLLFCTAKVMGQGTLKGMRILHAWNELGDVVFDYSNGHKIIMRKEKYYSIAQIKEEDVLKQNCRKVIKLMFETETYGGWIK